MGNCCNKVSGIIVFIMSDDNIQTDTSIKNTELSIKNQEKSVYNIEKLKIIETLQHKPATCKASKSNNDFKQILCRKNNCTHHFCYICNNSDANHTYHTCPALNFNK